MRRIHNKKIVPWINDFVTINQGSTYTYDWLIYVYMMDTKTWLLYAELSVNHFTWPLDCWNSIIRLSSNESVLTCVIMNYELKWDYMIIGTFHCLKVAKSITWTVISCWPSECIYTPACFSHVSGVTGSVLSYHPFYFCLPAGCLPGPLSQ